MSFTAILITILVAGLLMFLINKFFPMDGNFKKIFNIVAIVVMVCWLIKEFGLLKYLDNINF